MAKSKLTTCKACGAEIAKSAKVCPHCGAKNKHKSVLGIIGGVFLIIIGLGLLIGGLGGSGDSGKTVDPTAAYLNAVEEAASRGLELEGGESAIELEKDTFAWYFRGTVVNNKTSDLAYCQVEINLYDADGALLGTALDNVNNLKAGGKWKFKAMTLLSSDELNEVASWELGDITGY